MAHENAKSKYRDVVKNRGVDPDVLKSTSEERLRVAKSRSFCAGCKRRGHWRRDPECPLNAAKKTSPDKPKDGGGSKEAYVVQVAFEVGDAGGQGLVAITDSACSECAAGETWLQEYVWAAKDAGLEIQMLNREEDFRFGASRIFHSTYTATIMLKINEKAFMVRASIVSGDVPLLLSRGVLARLGMVYDIDEHRADFKALGVFDYPLKLTETGHPAIPVVPDAAAGFTFPTPKEWGDQEAVLLARPRAEYTVHMTGHAVGAGTGSRPECEPTTDNSYNIFFPKRISEEARNMLTADQLSHTTFYAWWQGTPIANDFWIEAPDRLVRVHVVPRKSFFSPGKWNTPHSSQRDQLLDALGLSRKTQGISCHTQHPLESVHDVWEDSSTSSYATLWIGRTVFLRKPKTTPSPATNGLRDRKERMEAQQGRAPDPCGGHGHPSTPELGNGRNSIDHPGAEGGTERGLRDPQGPQQHDPQGAHGQGDGDEDGAAGGDQAHAGPAPADDPGQRQGVRREPYFGPRP